MRFDTSRTRHGDLDHECPSFVVEVFSLIDQARRLAHDVERLMQEAPRLNLGPQRLNEQAPALSDEAKRLVREPVGVMHEVQKLDLDAKRVWVRAAVPTVAG